MGYYTYMEKIVQIKNGISDETRFIVANSISTFGSGLTYMLFVLFWAKESSLTYSSVVIGGYLWLNIISMVLTGKYIDNRRKDNLLRVIQLLCFIFMVIVVLAFMYRNEVIMIILFLMLALLNGVDANLASSILPEITKKNNIKKINTYLQLGGRFLGIFVGIIATWCSKYNRYSFAFMLDAITYLLAYFSYKKIMFKEREIICVKENSSYKALAINLIHDNKLIRAIVAIVLVNVALGSFDTLFPQLFAQNGWDINNYGYVNAAYSLGSFFVVCTLFIKNNRFLNYGIFRGTIVFACILFGTSFMRNEIITYILVGGLGFYSVIMLINTKSYVQINAGSAYLGKLMALMSVLLKVAKPIGVFISNITVYFSNGSVFLKMMSVVLIVYSLISRKGGARYEELSS